MVKLFLLSLSLLGIAGQEGMNNTLPQVHAVPIKRDKLNKPMIRYNPLLFFRGEDVFLKALENTPIYSKITDYDYSLDKDQLTAELLKFMVCKGSYDEDLEVRIISDITETFGIDERAIVYEIVDSFKRVFHLDVIFRICDVDGPTIRIIGEENIYSKRKEIYVSSDEYLDDQDIKNRFICFDEYDKYIYGKEDVYFQIIHDDYHKNSNWKYPGKYRVKVALTDITGNERTFEFFVVVFSLLEGDVLFGDYSLIVTPTSIVSRPDIYKNIHMKSSPSYADYYSLEGNEYFDEMGFGETTLDLWVTSNQDERHTRNFPINLIVAKPVKEIPQRYEGDNHNPDFVENNERIRVGKKEDIEEKKEKSFFAVLNESFQKFFEWIKALF